MRISNIYCNMIPTLEDMEQKQKDVPVCISQTGPGDRRIKITIFSTSISIARFMGGLLNLIYPSREETEGFIFLYNDYI